MSRKLLISSLGLVLAFVFAECEIGSPWANHTVERGIAWIVTNGHRRVRYRGVEANRAQLVVRVAAINLGLHHNRYGWAIS